MKLAGQFDVIIVGAGIAGMYMLYRMRELGLSTRVIERATDVGGTWYWNRYPGARCDVDSVEYSYSFDEELQQEWEWSSRYPTQSELLAYLNHVADRFDLRPDITFNTRVEAALFDEVTHRWQVQTDDGAKLSAQFLIMATGCLSTPYTPSVEGMETFTGPIYQTSRWPHEDVDFSGQRVGIIGTGSSGVQAIPVIARQAEHLTVFQRSPQYSLPARNQPLDPDFVAKIKADYAGFRARNRLLDGANSRIGPGTTHHADCSAMSVREEERQRIFEECWQVGGPALYACFNDINLNPDSNQAAADFVRAKIRKIVKDPKVAERLCPTHTFNCKRGVIDSGFFETFNRSNVLLVDVSATPIEAITPGGVRTTEADYDLDIIIFATGFDAMTGTLLKIDIQGRQGLTLREKWAAGPVNYLGLNVSGFPNFFTITGPGSPSVTANMVVDIEQHVEWITDCIHYMLEHHHTCIEATEEAQDTWVAHVNELADKTLAHTCHSWYLGANIPGKPRVFLPYVGGFPSYVEKCQAVVANWYEGFVFW